VQIQAVAGFVSAADVLDAVLAEVVETKQDGAAGTLEALEAAAEAVCARPVGSLLVATGAGGGGGATTTVGAVREATAGRDWGLLHGPPGATSLLDALAFHFFRPGAGGGGGAGRGTPRRLPVHRLGLTVGSSLAGLLSQSDVVAALAAAPAAAWGAAAGAPLDAFAPPARPVVSIPSTASALDAFTRMRSAGLPGLAVVHPDTGALVGHLSASDARCLSVPMFPALALPVLAFLADRPLLASASLDSSGGAGGVADAVAQAAAAGATTVAPLAHPHAQAGRRLLTAVPGLGLRAAAAALAAARVHQLYEVDATGAPVRVVSVSDVLSAVLAAAGGAPE